MNIMAIFHSYKFTHFASESVEKTAQPGHLSGTQKMKALLFGVSNPRPVNTVFPVQEYETISLQSNKSIECWRIPVANSKGTVVLFHGYGGSKSSMLDKSNIFLQLGFSAVLVDFMGSGGSEGNQTTIGFHEAAQVNTVMEYLKNAGEDSIILFGTSMGAVSVMKAIHDYHIQPAAIILECPFGSMYETVGARFKNMNVPKFPMAPLLVFWGGAQNGFWAFGHNPARYASRINSPTLLMYGEKDKKVSRS